MRRLLAVALAALGLASITATAAETPVYPSTGVLYDVYARAVLRVACEPPDGKRMRCAFTEIEVEPGRSEPLPATALPPKSECGNLPAFAAALTEGIPPTGADAEIFKQRFAKQAAGEKADVANFLAALRDYCADKADASNRLAEVMASRIARTCTLTISAYRLDFDWNGEHWRTQSAPADDACGTTSFGRFEPTGPSPRAPWHYRLGSRATKGGTCPTKPQTEHLYAADPADIYVGCDYLRFRG